MSYFTKSSKRNIDPQDLTPANLVSWRSAVVHLYVYVYSKAISSLAIFKKVKKALLDPEQTDRSGAAAIVEIQEVVQRLKEIHKYNYAGAAISWTMWANKILASESHLRDGLMHSPPPGSLIELFTRAPDHADNILRNVRSNVSIGVSMNRANVQHLREIRATLDDFGALLGNLNLRFQELDSRVKLMENGAESNSELLNVVEDAVHENTFSQEAYNLVSNVPDYDHE